MADEHRSMHVEPKKRILLRWIGSLMKVRPGKR